MRFGICTGIENIPLLTEVGYDYFEWSVSTIASLSEQDFREAKNKLNQCALKPEVCNVFFPGTMALTGPDVDFDAVVEYIKKALGRVAELGTQIIVVGSGKSRKVPEGWEKAKGVEQFCTVLRKIVDEAAQYGIMALIEPLNKGETNIVNSVAEGHELVKLLGHPNIKLLADFYHMRLENESMEGLIEAGSEIKHLHIANSHGRVYPLDVNEDNYVEFFEALRKIGYNGRISIEASAANPREDAIRALKLLKELA